MSVVVREIDVRSERSTLAPFLAEHLALHRNPSHYDWLYLGNPWGVARAWVAISAESERVVGAAAAFPRKMFVDGEETTCWNLGDFAIHPEYRSLGPAVTLQRRCLEEVTAGRVAFAYDHPSCGMMAVYRWLRIEKTGDVARYTRPLRVDAQVEKLLPKGMVSRGISGVGNVLLSLTRPRLSAESTLEVAQLDTRFDAELAGIAKNLGTRHSVVGARTEAYLNWRFLDNPHADHDVVTVSERGVPHAYAVVRWTGDLATIVDLAYDGRSSVMEAALAGSVELARQRDARTLNLPTLESNAFAEKLESLGFRRRESRVFVVTTRSGGSLDGRVNRAASWYLLDGDRDA